MKVNINGLTVGKNYIIGCEANGKNSKGISKYKIGVYQANDGTPVEAELKKEGLVAWRLLKVGKFSVATNDIHNVIYDFMKKLDVYHLENFGEVVEPDDAELNENEGNTYAFIGVWNDECESVEIDYFKAENFMEALKMYPDCYDYKTNKYYLDNVNIDKEKEIAWSSNVSSSPILYGEYEGILEDVKSNFKMVINVEKNINCEIYKEILKYNNDRGLIDTTLSASSEI